MVKECLVDLFDISAIPKCIENNCTGVFYRSFIQNGEFIIENIQEKFQDILRLSHELDIFLEITSSDNTTIKNIGNIIISSDDKNILKEIYIKEPNIKLGLIEKPHEYINPTIDIFFIQFIILNYRTITPDKISRIKNKYPDIKIYVRGGYTEKQVKRCFQLKVNGIITHKPELYQKYGISYK